MPVNRLFRVIRQTRSWSTYFQECVTLSRTLENISSEATAASAAREKEQFSELFRESKFAASLDPVGSTVEAEVLAVVDGNMYVDFGCKFHAVVPVPSRKTYARGSKVKVRVLNLEITDHFVGDHRDISLLEAEAELVE